MVKHCYALALTGLLCALAAHEAAASRPAWSVPDPLLVADGGNVGGLVREGPLLVLFTKPGCAKCDELRAPCSAAAETLAKLNREAAAASRTAAAAAVAAAVATAGVSAAAAEAAVAEVTPSVPQLRVATCDGASRLGKALAAQHSVDSFPSLLLLLPVGGTGTGTAGDGDHPPMALRFDGERTAAGIASWVRARGTSQVQRARITTAAQLHAFLGRKALAHAVGIGLGAAATAALGVVSAEPKLAGDVLFALAPAAEECDAALLEALEAVAATGAKHSKPPVGFEFDRGGTVLLHNGERGSAALLAGADKTSALLPLITFLATHSEPRVWRYNDARSQRILSQRPQRFLWLFGSEAQIGTGGAVGGALRRAAERHAGKVHAVACDAAANTEVVDFFELDAGALPVLLLLRVGGSGQVQHHYPSGGGALRLVEAGAAATAKTAAKADGAIHVKSLASLDDASLDAFIEQGIAGRLARSFRSQPAVPWSRTPLQASREGSVIHAVGSTFAAATDGADALVYLAGEADTYCEACPAFEPTFAAAATALRGTGVRAVRLDYWRNEFARKEDLFPVEKVAGLPSIYLVPAPAAAAASTAAGTASSRDRQPVSMRDVGLAHDSAENLVHFARIFAQKRFMLANDAGSGGGLFDEEVDSASQSGDGGAAGSKEEEEDELAAPKPKHAASPQGATAWPPAVLAKLAELQPVHVVRFDTFVDDVMGGHREGGTSDGAGSPTPAAEMDVLLLFYAPWCAHCKALAGPWEALARRHRGEPRLRIAKVDATRHEVPHPRVKLEGYPTVLLFGAGRAAKDAPVELRERTVEGFERALAPHLAYMLQPIKEEEEPTQQKLSPAPPAPQPEEPAVWSYNGDTAARIFKHAVKHHAILLFDSRAAALREETEKARASFGFRAADARRAAASGAPRVLYIEVDLAAGGDAAQEKKRAKLAAFLGMGAREKALGLAVVAMGSAAMDVFRYGGGWRKAEMESFERQYHAGELTPLQRGKKDKKEPTKKPEKKAARVEL
jgi:thiol-disulfide isomerase/thioredoxin